MPLSRRTLVKVPGRLGTLAAPRIGQAAAVDTRTLRFVVQANPVFTTAAVRITHRYCLFDTLYGSNGV